MNGDKKDIKTENDNLSSPEPINPLILNQELIAPASTSSVASNINIPLIEHKVQQFNVAQESKKRVPTYYENYDKHVQEVKQAEADEIKLGASNVIDSYYMNYSGGNKNQVASIQGVLFDEGYYPKGSKKETEVDGKFGPKTRKAYEKYVNQQLPNEAKDDWIDLSDVKKQLVCKEEGCAAFVTKTFEDHNVDVVGQGIVTDAWTMNKAMKDKGGKEKYNIYNKYDFSDVKTKEDLKRKTKKIKAKDHTNADMFQVGDVVGMYYDGSEYHEKALNEGTGTHNTHVGVVTRIKNGVPIVSHNVDGVVKHDPWNKVETGWIVSPNQSQTGQFEYDKEVPQHDNSRIISNISAAKEEVGSRPFTEKQVDSLNTNINHLKNDIPKLIKETQSAIDDDWLISTVLAITGKETGFGVHKPSKNEDLLAKTVKTIKGGEDYAKSIVKSSIEKRRLTKGSEERDPASSLYYSQGITKIKPGYLDEFSKRYLDVNVKNINDDRKALAATSMKLIKAYDYFTKYKENNPQLNLTEEDVRNVSILTFNEDLSKWIKLGYRNPNMFPVEEIKALRELYTGKVKDISSTKYSHIPDILSPIKEMLYEGEFPEGHETYISRVNKYGEAIREKAKGGKISTKGYLPNSPDKNEPSLVIPSQHLTTKGVSHKILATDRETGEQRIMNPEEEHFFNGKKGVQEIPLQDGGTVFDPDGSGYDDETFQELIKLWPLTTSKPDRPGKHQYETIEEGEAFQAWVWHEEDNDWFKHAGSLDPRTGMLLKGMNHPTIGKVDTTNLIKKDDGRYYNAPKKFQQGGQVTDVVPIGVPFTPEELINNFNIDPNEFERGSVEEHEEQNVEDLIANSNLSEEEEAAYRRALERKTALQARPGGFLQSADIKIERPYIPGSLESFAASFGMGKDQIEKSFWEKLEADAEQGVGLGNIVREYLGKEWIPGRIEENMREIEENYNILATKYKHQPIQISDAWMNPERFWAHEFPKIMGQAIPLIAFPLGGTAVGAIGGALATGGPGAAPGAVAGGITTGALIGGLLGSGVGIFQESMSEAGDVVERSYQMLKKKHEGDPAWPESRIKKEAYELSEKAFSRQVAFLSATELPQIAFNVLFPGSQILTKTLSKLPAATAKSVMKKAAKYPQAKSIAKWGGYLSGNIGFEAMQEGVQFVINEDVLNEVRDPEFQKSFYWSDLMDDTEFMDNVKSGGIMGLFLGGGFKMISEGMKSTVDELSKKTPKQVADSLRLKEIQTILTSIASGKAHILKGQILNAVDSGVMAEDNVTDKEQRIKDSKKVADEKIKLIEDYEAKWNVIDNNSTVNNAVDKVTGKKLTPADKIEIKKQMFFNSLQLDFVSETLSDPATKATFQGEMNEAKGLLEQERLVLEKWNGYLSQGIPNYQAKISLIADAVNENIDARILNGTFANAEEQFKIYKEVAEDFTKPKQPFWQSVANYFRKKEGKEELKEETKEELETQLQEALNVKDKEKAKDLEERIEALEEKPLTEEELGKKEKGIGIDSSQEEILESWKAERKKAKEESEDIDPREKSMKDQISKDASIVPEARRKINKFISELIDRGFGHLEVVKLVNQKFKNSIAAPIKYIETSTDKIDIKYERIIKKKQEKKEAKPEAKEKKEVKKEKISEKEYKKFVDTGKVSNAILQSIASKVKNEEALSEYEQHIQKLKAEEINKILADEFQQEINEAFEIADPKKKISGPILFFFESAKEAREQVAKSKNTKAKDAIGERVIHIDDEKEFTVGRIVEEEGIIMFRPDNDLGFALQLNNEDILFDLDLILVPEASEIEKEVKASEVEMGEEDNEYIIRGKTYKNLHSKPENAINRDDKGNIISVTLTDENENSKTFRNSEIIDNIAYNIILSTTAIKEDITQIKKDEPITKKPEPRKKPSREGPKVSEEQKPERKAKPGKPVFERTRDQQRISDKLDDLATLSQMVEVYKFSTENLNLLKAIRGATNAFLNEEEGKWLLEQENLIDSLYEDLNKEIEEQEITSEEAQREEYAEEELTEKEQKVFDELELFAQQEGFIPKKEGKTWVYVLQSMNRRRRERKREEKPVTKKEFIKLTKAQITAAAGMSESARKAKEEREAKKKVPADIEKKTRIPKDEDEEELEFTSQVFKEEEELKKEDDKKLEAFKLEAQKLREQEKVLEARIANKLAKNIKNNIVPEEDSDLMKDLADLIALYLQHAGVTIERIIYQLKKNLGAKASNFIDKNVIKVLEKNPEGKKLLEKEKLQKEQEEQEILDVEFDDERVGTTLGKLFSILNEIKDINKKASVRDLLLLSTQLRQQINQQKEKLSYEEIVEMFKDSASFSKNTEKAVPLIASKFTPGEVVSLIAIASSHQVHPFFHFIGSNTGKWNVNLSNRAQEEKEDIDEAISIFNKTIQRREEIALTKLRESNNKLSKKERLTESQLKDKVSSLMENMYRSFIIMYLSDGITIEGRKYRGVMKISEEHKQESSENQKKELRKEAIETDLAWAKIMTGLDWTDYLNEYSNTYTGKYSNTYIHDFIEGNTNKVDIYSSLITKIGSYLFNVKTADYDKAIMQYRKQAEPWKSFKARIKEGRNSQIVTLSREKQARRAIAIFASAFQNVMNKRGEATILDTQISEDAANITKKPNKKYWNDNLWVQYFRDSKNPHPIRLNLLDGAKNVSRLESQERGKLSPQNFLIMQIIGFLQSDKFAKQASIPADYSKKVEGEYGFFIEQFGTSPQGIFASAPKWTLTEARNQYKKISKNKLVPNQTEANELIDDLAKWITDVLQTTNVIERSEIEDPHAFAEHFYYNFIVNKYYSDLYFQGKPEAFTKEGKFLYLESQVKRAQSRWSGGVVPLTNIKGGLKKKLNAVVVEDPKVAINLLGKTFAKDKELTDGLVFYRIKNIEDKKVKPGLGEQAVMSYGDIISKGAKSFPFMKLVYSQVRDNGMPFQLKSLWMGIDPALGELSPMLQSILDYMNKWNIDVFALDSSAKLKDETIPKGEKEKKDVMSLFNKRGIIKNQGTSPKIIEMDTDYLFMQQDYRKNVTMQAGGVKEQGGSQAKRGTMTFPHEISKTLNNIYSTIVDRKSAQLMSEINNEQNIYDSLVKQQTEQGKKINEKKLRKEARKQANEEWRKKLYNKVGDEDHLFYAKSMLKEMLTHPHLLEQEQKAINWGMVDRMLEAEVYGQVYMATPDLGYIKAYNKEGRAFPIGPLKAARIARIVNGVEVEISNEKYKKIKDTKIKKQYKILPAQALVPRNSGLEIGEQFFMGRIPHDGFHNQSLAEVIGFLPASMENIIAVDPVTSFIAGEDYDGDYRYIWSQKKNKEGEIVKYNEKYKDQYTDDGPLINEAFLQTSYVYQNPEFYEALIDPIVPKQIDKFIEHIRIEDSKISKYDFLEGMKKAYLSVKESGTMKGIIANNQAVFNYLASNRVGLRDQVIFPKIEYNKDSKKYEKVGEYTLQDFYVKDDTQELMNSLLGRNRQYSIIANENMDAIKLQNITPMGLSISTANVYSMLAMLGVEAKHIISFFNHETMKRYIMESKEEASVTKKVDKRAVLDGLITQTLTREEAEFYEKELEALHKGKPIPTRIKGEEEVIDWELELAKGIIKDKDVTNENTVNFYRLFRHLEDISSNMKIVDESLKATIKTSENYAVLHSRESSLNKLQNYDRTKEDAYIDFSTIESPEITTSFLYPGLKGIEAQKAFYALRRPIGREIGQKILYGIEKEFQNHFNHLESYTLGKEKVTMLEEALNEIWLGEAIKGILKGSKVSMDKEENSRIVLERIAKLKKSNRYKNNKIIKNLTIRDGKVMLKSTLAQDVEITPDQIIELKEAFTSLPKDLKLELVVYNFHEYGYKRTTFNGGFSFYVDNETNKNISEEMDSALEIFDDPSYTVPIYEHILVNNPKLVPSPLFFDENFKVFRAYSPIRNQTDKSFGHGIPNRMADYDNAQAFYLSGGYMPGYVRDHNTGNVFRRKEKNGRSYYDWSAPLPPTSIMRDVTKKTPPTAPTEEAPTSMGEITNHSGGALGADSIWDEIGAEFDMTKNKHYYTGKKTPKGNENITGQPIVKEGASKVAQAAKEMWGYKLDIMKDERLIRNWAQVKNSDTVFAISTIGKKGDIWNADIGKKNPRKLLKEAVQGGTGYAVEMAIQEGKPVYVYDQERKQWYKNIDGKWSKSEVPTLTKNFAGIGTRKINEFGKQAIRDVYEKTQASLEKAPEGFTPMGEVEGSTYGREFEKGKTLEVKGQKRKPPPKLMRGVDAIGEQLRSSNPELAKFIEEKFKKMFPNVDVRFVTNWVDEEGMDILGAAIGSTIYINTDKAVQSTFFHEHSHLYYDAMPSDNPIKKRLNEMFETEEDAILAIGRAGVELADEDLHLLGGITKYFTPKAFKILLKRFWRWIKRGFNISNKDDVARMMASEIWKNKAQLTSEDFISEQMKFMLPSYYLTDENIIANQEKNIKALKEVGFSWEDDQKLGKAAIVMARNLRSDKEISLEEIERTEFSSDELKELASIGIKNPTLEVLTFGHLVLKQYKATGGFETITVKEPRVFLPELEKINEEIKQNIKEYNRINSLNDKDISLIEFPMSERFDIAREAEEVRGISSKKKREIWLSTIKEEIEELKAKKKDIEERHPRATYDVPALIKVNPQDPTASIEVEAKPGDKMTPAPKTIQGYFNEAKNINKEQYGPGGTLNLGIPDLTELSEEEQSKRLIQWTEDDLEQNISAAAKKNGIKSLIQEYQKYVKDFKEIYEMFNNTFPDYTALFNTSLSKLDEILFKIKNNRDLQAQVGFKDVVQSVYAMQKFKEFIKNPKMDAFGSGYKLWAEAFYDMYGLGPMERGKGRDLKVSWLGRWGTSPKDYRDKVMQLKNYIIKMTRELATRESGEISRQMSTIEKKVLKEGYSIEETLYTYDKEGEKRLRDIYWKENKRPNDLKGLSKNQEDYLRLYVNSVMRNMPEGAYRLETIGNQERSNYDNNILYKKPVVEADFFELLKRHGLYKAIELKTFGKNRLGYILIHAEGYEEPITLESAREDILENIKEGKIKRKAGEKLWKEYQDQAKDLFERGMDANYNSLYNVTNITVPLSGIDFMSEDKIVEEAISKNTSATIKKYIRELSYKNHMEKVLPLAHFFNKFYEDVSIKGNFVKQMLETYDNEIFFKQSPESAFPKYEKAVRWMTGWTALRFLALNYLAPIFNISAGQSQNFIDMEPKIWARGMARLVKNPYKAYKIMGNMEIVNTSIDAELSIPKENIRKIQRVFFLGIEIAENLNQGVMFLGMMGDKFNHYNINGEVKKGKQGLTINEQYYITHQIQRSHGPYHPAFRRQMNLTAEGQAMIQFKGWMPEMFQRYIQNPLVDEHGKLRKGILHTLWEEESRESILEYLSGKRKWESISQVDRYNLARGLRTLVMLSLFALWISLLDEDDENKDLADKLRRALGDVTYMFDIDNLQFLIAAPVPMLSTITDTLGAFGELIEGSKYTRDSKYGKEGQYKWIPSLVKATFPFRRPTMALYENYIVD